MSDMSNLYRAYSAVHNVEIKEELQQSRDLISEMNMSRVLQSDLVEVCEEIVEGLFQYGLDLDGVSGVISTLLEKVREGSSNELREGKIDQIAEAFGTVVDTVTNKAERNCEEEFLLYRKNKPLTEKWNNRVSHEVGNAKLHASLIHEDRHQIKFGLIEMMSDLMEKGMNPGFKAYLEKQKAKKGKGGDEKEGKSEGGGKPDFLDLDKDGDKKEPMKKAAKEKKDVKEARMAGESPKEYASRMTKKFSGGKSKSYDPMKDKSFDHDEAEKTRGQSGKFSKEELEAIQAKVDSWED